MKKAPMTFIYTVTWWTCHAFFTLLFRGRWRHPERLPMEGPVILASNHESFMDPPLVGCGLPRPVNYLARETLFHNKAFAWYMRQVHCVPVDRDGAGAAGLRAILERLERGEVILLFPEGTRSPDGRLGAARAGVGLTVIKSGAPVLPVRVFGTYQALSRHHKVPRFFRRVGVHYGEPIDFTALREEVKTCSKQRAKEIYQEVADRIMAEIAKLELD